MSHNIPCTDKECSCHARELAIIGSSDGDLIIRVPQKLFDQDAAFEEGLRQGAHNYLEQKDRRETFWFKV